MYQDERKLDFKPLGIAIKKAREAKGWTQEYLAQLVDLTPRSIMYWCGIKKVDSLFSRIP